MIFVTTGIKDDLYLSELSVGSIEDRSDQKIKLEDGSKRYYIDRTTLASMKDYCV